MKRMAVIMAMCVLVCMLFSQGAPASAAEGMNMYQNSDFIEKEQPELSEETKQMISLYQR